MSGRSLNGSENPVSHTDNVRFDFRSFVAVLQFHRNTLAVILKTVAEADMVAKQAKSFWCCILSEQASTDGMCQKLFFALF